jgi:hypothetical protein
MKRTLITLAAAAAALTTLPGCSYFEQRELKSALTECLALQRKTAEPYYHDMQEMQGKSESEPLAVALDFAGDTATLKIVNIDHWAPTQSGPGAKEAAKRLKPLANRADRAYTSISTFELLYQRKDGEWQIKSGTERFATLKGVRGERSEREPEVFGEAEVLAGLVSDLSPLGGAYAACRLGDKRLTQAK